MTKAKKILTGFTEILKRPEMQILALDPDALKQELQRQAQQSVF